MASPAFDQFFARHAMTAYARQLALADLIQDAGSWDLDLDAGTLSFAQGLTFRIGLLGSWGEAAGTWLWSWANTNMTIDAEVAAPANTLRQFGRARDIPELHESQTHGDETFCHRLALASVGETGAGAYYRAPYEGGAAYLTIRDPLPAASGLHALARVQRVIAESISSFDMPHRTAIDSYFNTGELAVDETGPSEIIASLEDGDLRIRFDDEGRLTEMKSLLRAATKPEGGFFNRLFRKDESS